MSIDLHITQQRTYTAGTPNMVLLLQPQVDPTILNASINAWRMPVASQRLPLSHDGWRMTDT